MTLVELIATIAILSVVTTGLMGLIQSFYKDNSYLIEQTAALDSARRGVNDAIVTLREASYGDDGSYPLASAATSSITVYADTDKDDAVERIRYSLIKGVFYKTTANATGTPPVYPVASQATTTIATNVRNTSATPLFTYYDNNGVQLATTSPNISQISSVRVQLYVDLNPNRAPNVFTLSETATLRNLQKQ
jgi:type II secretory pathway pseudopilin PulG